MSEIAEAYGYWDVGEEFTRREVVRAVIAHGHQVGEFDAEVALAEVYDADEVLAWLGY